MSVKAALRQEAVAIGVAAALTVVVAVETLWSPTAPFFLVYAVLALAVPLFVRDFRFGSLRDAFRGHAGIVAAVFAVAFVSDVLFVGPVWDGIAKAAGHEGSAFYSLTAAVDMLLVQAGATLGIGKDAAQALFAAYFLLWGPIAEELFYRGYVFQALRTRRSFATAALVSAAFFSIRHATHFLFLLPDFPAIAALVWVADTFVLGVTYAYLYERTKSLWPGFLVHLVVNLIGMVLSALQS